MLYKDTDWFGCDQHFSFKHFSIDVFVNELSDHFVASWVLNA